MKLPLLLVLTAMASLAKAHEVRDLGRIVPPLLRETPTTPAVQGARVVGRPDTKAGHEPISLAEGTTGWVGNVFRNFPNKFSTMSGVTETVEAVVANTTLFVNNPRLGQIPQRTVAIK